MLTGFDTGPQFVFNFGGPGIRVHQFGGGRPRRRPREGQQQESSLTSTIMGLLPILILFIFPLISSLFSGGTTQPAGPRMVFDEPQGRFTMPRVTTDWKVKYFVDPKDVESYSKYKFSQLDKTAELGLFKHLKVECENEMAHKERLYQEAQGWFYQDVDKLNIADQYQTPSCKRLDNMGIPVRR